MAADKILAQAPDDDRFAALMTNVQFHALAVRLSPQRLVPEVRVLLQARKLERGAKCEDAVVNSLLMNGWNTEHLLHVSASHLTGDALRQSLHWAFPQAYYSVYSLTLAYFKAIGYTEESHTALIRKFGQEARASRYPAAMSCIAEGGKQRTYRELCCTSLPTTLHFDPAVVETVDGQIAQFLSATRRIDLRTRKGEMRLRTRKGKTKKALSATDWTQVGSSLGATSILSLLYRKRLQANYRSIETLLHAEVDADSLYRNLIRVTGALNFTHEVLITRALGKSHILAAIQKLPPETKARLETRFSEVSRSQPNKDLR